MKCIALESWGYKDSEFCKDFEDSESVVSILFKYQEILTLTENKTVKTQVAIWKSAFPRYRNEFLEYRIRSDRLLAFLSDSSMADWESSFPWGRMTSKWIRNRVTHLSETRLTKQAASRLLIIEISGYHVRRRSPRRREEEKWSFNLVRTTKEKERS